MKTRLAQRREGIISLTQTEIMLVLAVVVLLLLLIKDINLKNVCIQAPEVCNKVQVLLVQKQAAAAAGPLTEEELDEEISAALAQGGENNSGDGLSELSPENETAPGETKEDIAKLKSDKEKLGRVNDLLRKRLNAANSELRERRAALAEKDRELEKLRTEKSALAKEVAALPAPVDEIQKIRDEVGFIPCWLNKSNAGPRYYQTYDITYYPETKTYSINDQAHWSNAAVLPDLDGRLNVLRQYPQGKISRNEFERFAKRVRAAKERAYGTECRLAVTINKKGVDGTITRDFIYDAANFYPVYR